MVTKSTKDIENIVMDTCVRVKYDGDGLSGAFNGCCFAQGVSEKGRVCHWLSPHDVTIFDSFLCNGNTRHVKNRSSTTSLQLNNIRDRKQYHFRGIFENKIVDLSFPFLYHTSTERFVYKTFFFTGNITNMDNRTIGCEKKQGEVTFTTDKTVKNETTETLNIRQCGCYVSTVNHIDLTL